MLPPCALICVVDRRLFAITRNSAPILDFREKELGMDDRPLGEQGSRSETPFVSVVVSFHNEGAALRKCLPSLLSQTYPHEKYEIILVDDGSNDGSAEEISQFVRSNSPRIRILRQPDRGPAAGRNLGIRNAQGSITLFTDPDCLADNDWIFQHVRHYASPQVGGVEGYVKTDWDQLLYPIRVAPAGFRYVTCNISYRRETLEKVGFFDENFRYREDDDLAYTVMEAGWEIISERNAVIYHPVKNQGLRGVVSIGLKHRYDPLFYKKHPDAAMKLYRFLKFGPFILSPEFRVCIATIIGFVLLAATFSIDAVLGLLVVSVLIVGGVFQRHKMLRRKAKASLFWMGIYILFIEIGRLQGSLKVRQLLL